MKNSIFSFIMVLLIMSSCKEAQKEEQTTTGEDSATEDTSLNSSCYNSVKIDKNTAWIWEQSWVSTETSIYPKDSVSTSPELHFSTENIHLLMPPLKENNGALLYYILKDETEKIPSLAMIQTDKCVSQLDQCEGNCVLASWYNGEQEFIRRDSLQKYKSYWKTHIEGVLPSAKLFVEGYNYSWALIDYLSKDKQGITVKYGVRTLGPGEILEFVSETDSLKNTVGIPVICNIIIGLKEGQTFQEAAEEIEEYDFAKPCPHYCD